MRGKVDAGTYITPEDRITPAYAGKSFSVDAKVPKIEDHPRLCGEKSMSKHRKRQSTGSPPPMRGKGDTAFAVQPQVRITPAYAGKRRRRS